VGKKTKKSNLTVELNKKKTELLLKVLKLNWNSSVRFKTVQFDSKQFNSVTKIQFRLFFFLHIFFKGINNNTLVQFETVQFGLKQFSSKCKQFSSVILNFANSLVQFSFHHKLNHAHPYDYPISCQANGSSNNTHPILMMQLG